MAGGLESTITEYEAYGPLVASFLANLLAIVALTVLGLLANVLHGR